MMKKSAVQSALAITVVLLSAFILLARDNKNVTDINNLTMQPGNKFSSPPLPLTLSFCGEEVPLEKWYIKEQLDRQVTLNYYWQGEILYLLKLSKRCFPVIEARLKANGVPDDMKYLCVAESKLQNQVSRVGAAGFWQFMPGTAPAFGLEISADIDERYDLEKSTDAACKYLKQAYAKSGSWTAAAASYNCGQGGYNNNATFQKTSNYYDILLPEETNQYIFRILTFKYLMGSHAQLGFNPGPGYQTPKMKQIEADRTIPDLVAFAIRNGTTYKMLKQCNPWLKSRSLSVKQGKKYVIQVPE